MHNKLGDRSFSAAGPRLWNDLPRGLRRPGLTFDSFRPALKSHLYLATEALSDSVEFIAAIEINLSIYLSRDEWRKFVHGVANPRIEDG